MMTRSLQAGPGSWIVLSIAVMAGTKKEFLGPAEKSWKISKDNVAVEIWEGKAKINVKVSPGTGPNISMKRIASIVVDAILEELKKEG